MPRYTKQTLLQQYRNTYPDTTLNDDKLFYEILKSNPNLKNSVSDYDTAATSSILDHLPSFIKEGYNRSITGHADELLMGRKRFDMSNYNPGVIEDIASSAVSLLVPTDWLALGPASKVFGTAGKVLFKGFAGAGVPKKIANDAVKKAIAQKTGQSAGVFATYNGLGNALRQQIDTGEIKLEDVAEESLKGSLIGAITGGVGGTLGARGASSLTKVAAETGVLGTVAPLVEGQLPTPEDYLHTAGVILGVKGGQKLFSSPAKMKRLFEKPKKDEKFIPSPEDAKKIAETNVAYDLETAMMKNEWRSGQLAKGKKPFSRVRIAGTQGEKYRLEDLNTKKYMNMEVNSFHKLYKRGGADLSIQDIRKSKEKEIADLETKLGYNGKRSQGARRKFWINEDGKFSTLKQADDKALFNYKERLKAEDLVMTETAKLLKDGYKINTMPKDNFIDTYFPKKVAEMLEVFKGPELRFKDPMARKYQGDVQKYFDRKAELTSIFFNQGIKEGIDRRISRKELRKGGFKNENEYWENFSDRKERGELPVWDTITNYPFLASREAGIQVPGYTRNYVPQMFKPEIAEIVFNNVQSVAAKLNKASSVFDAYSGTKDWMKKNPERAAELEGIIKKANMSPELRQLIKMNMKTGNNPTLEAFINVGRYAYNDLYSVFGNLEKSRGKIQIPKEMRERNWKNLWYRYSYGSAKRIAEVETFGRKGEKFHRMLKTVEGNDNAKEASIMREVQSHVVGSINKDPAHNLSPTGKKIAENVMAWETSSKIALGTATIPNVSQFMISSALDAGYLRFFRGIISLADPKTREFIKRSGATEYSMLTELLGTSAMSSRTAKVADFLAKWSGFKGINKINQWTSAAAGQIFIKDLSKIATKSPIKARREWAQGKLSSMGIDYKKPISEKVLLHGVNRFAKDMNLQKDILKDPLIMNNPRSQWFFQFKRFGYRQFKLVDGILRDDLKSGNVMSVLRLGVAGYAGGTAVATAKKYMREFLSGEPSFDPMAEKFPEDFEELLENLAGVGALGMLGDMLSSTVEVGGSPADSLKFMASPPVLSSAEKLFQFFQRMESDAQTYGAQAIKRLPSRVSTLLGTVPSELMKRIEPEGLSEERLQGRKSREVRIINKYLDKGEYEKAYGRVRAWNATNPRNPITGRSISMKNTFKRMLQKQKKRQKNVIRLPELDLPFLD